MSQPQKLNPNDIIRRIMTVVNNNADLLPASLELNGSILQLKLFDENILSADLSSLGGNSAGDGIEEATDSAMGLVRYATTEELSRMDGGVVVDPQGVAAIFNTLMGLDESDPQGEAVLIGISRVLDLDNNATIPLRLLNGGYIKGKGKDAKGRDIRLKLDLDDTPRKGSFKVVVVDENSQDTTVMSLGELLGRAQDTIPVIPSENPGEPVVPVYANLQYTSGDQISTQFEAFKTASGQAYPDTITYTLYGLKEEIAGLRLKDDRVLAGTSVKSAIDKTFDLRLVGTPISGRYAGREYYRDFTLKLLAAVTPPAVEKPSIAAVGNRAAIQNQAFSFACTVTTSKNGTWSATGLPSGASINPITGIISGTPLNYGTFPATVTFTDTDGQSDTENFVLTVAVAPVTTWFLTGGYTTDVNTRVQNLFWGIAAGISSIEFAVECVDGSVFTGKTRSGAAWTTNPAASTGFWQKAFPESNGNGTFNFANSLYPASFSPVSGGIDPGKPLKLRTRRFEGDTEVIRYLDYPATPNIDPVRAFLTEAPGGGGGGGENRLPAPPTIGNQVAYVGVPFLLELPYFTDPDPGDTLTHTLGGYPNIYTVVNDTVNRKYIFSGTPQNTGVITLVYAATDNHGGQRSLPILLTQLPAPVGIAKVDGRFYAGTAANNAVGDVLGGGWMCHFLRFKGTNLPSGAVPQVGIQLYNTGGTNQQPVYWFDMVSRASGEFTNVQGHQVVIPTAGLFADYFVRVVNASQSVIVEPVKLYSRDMSNPVDSGTIVLYPTGSDQPTIVETFTF